MDLQLLRLYQGHVAFCCGVAIYAMDDINAFKSMESGRIWYGIQNFIIGAGNISKTLWGTGNAEERARRYAERAPLRESLHTDDASPLRHVDIRNDYEHLDERIERWWNESPNHNVADFIIGPPGLIASDAFGERDMLRHLDPTTGNVIFWGNELNLPTVYREVSRIYPLAVEESRKPHWEPPTVDEPSAGGGGQ